MFRFFGRTVSVSFIDDITGEQIAGSKVPLDQLPDTFARDTELELAGVRYVVARANPITKAEFAKTKRLTVRLRRLEMVDPKSLLFSLPSICGEALPRSAPVAASADVVVLHEDDWRQCEFVDVGQREDIAAELSSIRHIHAVAAAAVGWREIHVRERIRLPLPSGIPWTAIVEQLGAYEQVGGIAFQDGAQPVLGAVAARLPHNVIVWGVEESGALTVLCVENLETASHATIAALKRIADSCALALIHWCRCQVYSPVGTPIANARGAPWDISS